jgi:tetratricopeptide (TPR) repeat protein
MIHSSQELLRLSGGDIADLVNSADASSIAALLDALAAYLQKRSEAIDPSDEKEFIAAVEILACIKDELATKKFVEAAISCACFHFPIGQYATVIPLMERARSISIGLGEKMLTRRCCNVLGAIYRQILNWEEAFKRLDEAFVLAREMNHKLLECSARANIAALFQDMGMYRDAMRMNDDILSQNFDDPRDGALRLQCLANNLLGAMRLHDLQAARHYAALGERIPFRYQVDSINAALFEYHRSLLLIREHQADLAQQHIDRVRADWPLRSIPRVALLLLDIASGLCLVAVGNSKAGLALLHDVYGRTKTLGSHKDDALEALIEASEMLNDWPAALRYKKELQAFSSARALD